MIIKYISKLLQLVWIEFLRRSTRGAKSTAKRQNFPSQGNVSKNSLIPNGFQKLDQMR